MHTSELAARAESQAQIVDVEKVGATAQSDTFPAGFSPYTNWQKFSAAPELVLHTVQQLSPSLQQLYVHVLKQTGPLPFHEEMIELWQYADAAAAEVIAALPVWYKEGLLAVFRKAWGERLYVVPVDVYVKMLQHDLASLSIDSADELPIDTFAHSESGQGVINDLFRLLVFTANEGLPVTAKGTLHKRTIQRLESQLQMSTEALSACRVSYAFADTVSPKLAVSLDLAMRLGLIRKDTQSFSIQIEPLYEWLQMPYSKWNEAIWLLVGQHYTAANVHAKHLFYAISAAARPGEWIQAESIVQQMQESGWLRFDAEQSLIETMKAWLQALYTFGWCELRTVSDESLWYKWLLSSENDADEQVEDGDGFFVQPDFEIIVPPDCSMLIRWRLEQIAEHISSSGMHMYRLTRDSFQAAIDAGQTRKQQQEFLERYALTGVPENIIDAWERWNEQYGRAWFSEVVLLRCEDESAAHLIQQECEQGRLTGKLSKIGPDAFVVARDQVEQIRMVMEQIGLPLLKNWRNDDYDEPASTEQHGAEDELLKGSSTESVRAAKHFQNSSTMNGIVYSPSSLQYYEMDMAYCRDESWLSSYIGLPLMWTKEVRTYHASTMKEIVETAIRLKLALQMKENGQLLRVVPIRLNGQSNMDFALEVYMNEDSRAVRKTLMPNQWEGVRLLVPEWL
ncbi:helicase-associated domain-containing protein [Paenibacillus assamensis]|uniref:helicase-associated domain-containing protein n=1 Tax=Paenibacillus assamensis TaxID=311244 RepID=UPI000415147E|nr:helicase-associated domain-containing protein [Paenibacillus assamensis]